MSGVKLVGVLTVIHRTGSYSVEDFGPSTEIEALKAEIHKVVVVGESGLALLAIIGPNKGRQIPVPICPLSQDTKSLYTPIMTSTYLTAVMYNPLMLSLHHQLFAGALDLVKNRTEEGISEVIKEVYCKAEVDITE